MLWSHQAPERDGLGPDSPRARLSKLTRSPFDSSPTARLFQPESQLGRPLRQVFIVKFREASAAPLQPRSHSARASCSWSTNTWRGGWPKFASGEHIPAAARPKRISSASLIFRRRARTSSSWNGWKPTEPIITSPGSDVRDSPASHSRLGQLFRIRY
jgi:hypothetical protein